MQRENIRPSSGSCLAIPPIAVLMFFFARCRARSVAEPARQFSTERVNLLLRLGRTLDVAKLFRLFQPFAKFAQPRLVCRLGLLVQQLAGVAQSTDVNSRGLQFLWIRRQSGRRRLRLVAR